MRRRRRTGQRSTDLKKSELSFKTEKETEGGEEGEEKPGGTQGSNG